MVNFHVLSIFPEMFESFLGASICKRALEAGHIGIALHNFRDYTEDKHRRVDDAPFGGGAGMLIAPQSVFDCFRDIEKGQQGPAEDKHLFIAGGRGADAASGGGACGL